MKVLTAVVNNPDFIIMQHATLRRHFKGDYEFIVFNDAKSWAEFSNFDDPTTKSCIEETCKALGIRCINIPNEHHRHMSDPAIRCADAHNYILKWQLANPDQYLVIDSDMFLIADVAPQAAFGDNCCAAVFPQYRSTVTYIHSGIYWFDIPKMPRHDLLNWDCCLSGIKTDVGGMMQHWLATAAPPVRHIVAHTSGEWTNADWSKGSPQLMRFLSADPRNPKNGRYFCEIYDDAWLHYRSGGNWQREGAAMHRDLTMRLKAILMNQ